MIDDFKYEFEYISRIFSSSHEKVIRRLFVKVCSDLHRWYYRFFQNFKRSRTASRWNTEHIEEIRSNSILEEIAFCVFFNSDIETSCLSFEIQYSERKNWSDQKLEIFENFKRVKNRFRILWILHKICVLICNHRKVVIASQNSRIQR